MTHTTHPWTASWADNGIATLRDSEGNHFANFRNVRGDEISTVNADLAVVVAAPKLLAALKALLEHAEALNSVAPISQGPRATCPRFGFNPYAVPQFNAARAAIAEAEGGAA